MVAVKKMALAMAMKLPNSQGISMSGSCEVLDDTDLLEEILVRVPHESIFSCILVSNRWFGLISGSCFREHYIRRWSDEVKLMRSAEVSELQHRLQSQQLAALDQLQHRLAENQPHHHLRSLNKDMHRLCCERVAALNKLDNELQLAAWSSAKLCYAMYEYKKFEPLNDYLWWRQSQVLAEVRESVKQLPCQRWAAVSEVQHQIVCRLLVAVNEAQRRQYWDMISKP